MSAVRPHHRAFAASLTALFVALAVLLAYRGWSFYTLPLHDRPGHPDFRVLRPTGFYGNGYGFAGAFLILTNLVYLARRRIHGFTLGSMRFWLDLHVFTGLSGGLLIAFHSAFQLRSPLTTISAASLAVVVATGIVGRLLYALVPESGETDLRDALHALGDAVPELPPRVVEILAELPVPRVPPNATLLQCLATVPRWRRASYRRQVAVRMLVDDVLVTEPRERRRELRSLGRAVALAAAGEVRGHAGVALLRTWRSLHRLFALTMLVTVSIHIGVAWFYGYRWVFG
jgi:hypothetical protein